MNTPALVSRARALGAVFTIIENQVRVSVVASETFPPELRAELKARKAEVVAVLSCARFVPDEDEELRTWGSHWPVPCAHCRRIADEHLPCVKFASPSTWDPEPCERCGLPFGMHEEPNPFSIPHFGE